MRVDIVSGTGDIDLRVYVTLPDYTPASRMDLGLGDVSR